MQVISNETDQVLIELVKNNSDWAINELMLRYQPKVQRLCNRFFYNSDDAADVTQTVFINLFVNNKIHTYRGESKFWVWLYRIVINSCKTAIKNRTTYEHRLSIIEYFKQLKEPVEYTPRLLKTYHIEQSEKQLIRAIRKLSVLDQKIITSTYFSKNSYKKTAALLNIPRSTVGVRLLRAKKKLAKIYKRKDNRDTLGVLGEYYRFFENSCQVI